VILSVVGRQCDGTIDVANRFVVLARLMESQSEKMQRIGMIGIDSEDFPL